jgi:glycosyltransferase involved in cell wall biosynthesis
MRVGLNGLLCAGGHDYRQTGVSRYIDELTSALAALEAGPDLLAYVNRGFVNERWDDVELRTPAFSVGNPTVRIGWEMLGLPLATRRDRIEIFHGTVNTIPYGLRARRVVTVHDLAFLKFPNQVTARRYQYLRRMTRSSVKRADIVLTPSEATRRDVIERMKVGPAKVRVTPLGVDARFRPVGEAAIATVRERFALERPYVLTVGTIEPRKNLPMLVRAFSRLRDEFPHDLVLAGPAGWLMEETERTIADSQIQGRVRRIGFVDDGSLAALYSGASLVAVPSLYEGFGLPVLEAMAAGAPVLTSNVSSMPEVAGDAAILVDPTSLDSVVAGLRSVLGSDTTASRLREAGPSRASEFSWERTARLTLESYRSVAQ